MKTRAIDHQSPVPKYYQLAGILRDMIRKRVYPVGYALPSEPELCRMYKLARATVRQALAELERESCILREQGRETLVISEYGQTAKSEQHFVAVMITCHGHVYENYLHHVVGRLNQKGLHPVLFNVAEIEAWPNNYLRNRRLDRLLRYRPSGMIIEGRSYFPFQWVKDHPVNKLVFTLYYEYPEPILNARYVLIDYEKGGYAGIRHLIEQGRSRIALLTFKPQQESFYMIQDFLKGCKRAFDEAGMDGKSHFEMIIAKPDPRKTHRLLMNCFRQKKHPDAVFAVADVRARSIYRAAADAGLKIPRDLAVLGFYNTPWCDSFDPPLSSISVHEDEIAKMTVSLLETVKTRREIIRIAPTLVLRKSTMRG